jgi:FAD/FMN-containing dehydrogenase
VNPARSVPGSAITGFGGTVIRPDQPGYDTAAYGRTIERLRQVKAVYDPANVFRLNQNIEPAAAPA